jgi:hypothetical protein
MEIYEDIGDFSSEITLVITSWQLPISGNNLMSVSGELDDLVGGSSLFCSPASALTTSFGAPGLGSAPVSLPSMRFTDGYVSPSPANLPSLEWSIISEGFFSLGELVAFSVDSPLFCATSPQISPHRTFSLFLVPSLTVPLWVMSLMIARDWTNISFSPVFTLILSFPNP